MSQIKLSDLIEESALKWPKEYLAELERIIEKSGQLGKGTAKQGADELSKVQTQLANATQKGTQEYIKQKAELDKLNKTNREAVKDVVALDSAYDKLDRELQKARKAYKDMAAAGKENTAAGKALLQQVTQLDSRLKQIDKTVGQTNRSVGNYTQSIRNALPFMGSFGSQLGVISMQLGAMQGILRSMIPAIDSNSSAFKRLRVALISTGIGAIVVALGTLIAAFASTQRGMDEINKVLRPLTFLFQSLWGVIQDVAIKGFEKLGEAIKNPKQAILDLADAIKTNIINRFKSFITIMEATQLLLDGKFKEAAIKAGDAFVQFTTGITDASEKLAGAGESVSYFVSNAIKEGQRLDDLIKQLEQRQIDLAVPLGAALLKYNQLREIANDQLKTDQEMIDAINQAEKELQFIISAEKELRDLEIEIAELKATANDTDRKEQLRIQNLKRARLEEEAAAQRKVNALVAQRSMIEKRQVEESKKANDAIIKNTIQSNGLIVNSHKEVTENYLSELDKRVKATAEAAKKERDEIARAEAEKQELRNEIIQQGIDGAKEIFQGFTDLRIQQIQQELTALEFARNRDLENAGDNERTKYEINRKYDEQAKKLKRKQANAEKQNALFNIAINTAMGIASAASKIITLPLIPLIAGIGLAQAAFVLARKVPEFDVGTESTPKDYIAGEKRPELRKSKGKWSLVDKPTLFKNSPGDKIVSGKETDSILGTIQDITGRNLLENQVKLVDLLNDNFSHTKKDDNLAYILKRNNEDLIRTIKNKKEVSVKVSGDGNKVFEKSGNTIVHRIDYYYKR